MQSNGFRWRVYEAKLGLDWNWGPLKLIEHHVYGSSRLGIIQRDQNMDSLKADPVNQNLIGSTWLYYQQRGKKLYELSNHLGNVLVTISDKKFGHVNGGLYDYYNADVINATDYYPFGMMMPNRTYSAQTGYRYGFNGKENDDEVKGKGNQIDYGLRVYDSRLGRFLSVDPLTKNYPMLTPYAYAENDVIRNIDLDGGEKLDRIKTVPYDGSGWDYLRALDNGSRNIVNIVPDVWNSAVDTYRSLRRGTYVHDLTNEIKATGSNIKQSAVSSWNYTWSTPIKQQLKEAVSPQAVEQYFTFAAGYAMANPTGTAKNLLSLESAVTTALKADLPAGTKALGPTFSRMGSNLTKKASEFKLLHSAETITKSADYKVISQLSDEELIKSVTKPSTYKPVSVNSVTGNLSDGNTRIYELQRRKLNVDVPYQEYTPDNSMFIQPKEPPKKL